MNQAENIQAIYPLAPLQEGMLFHTVADPDSGVYIEQSAYTLDGKIDAEHFRAAWQTVIGRHAVLRTAFPTATIGWVVEERWAELLCTLQYPRSGPRSLASVIALPARVRALACWSLRCSSAGSAPAPSIRSPPR